MTSQVEICNQACTKIGAARILSIDDDVKQAKALKAIWSVKRDAELAAHPWAFAITRTQLPASATAPAYRWARAFPLPVDFLAPVEIGDQWALYSPPGGPWFEIEGGEILTNEASPLKLRYIRRVENTGLWAPLFVEALACRLAAEIAEDVTQSTSKRELAWQEWDRAIRTAKRANAIAIPPQPTPESGWWLARP